MDNVQITDKDGKIRSLDPTRIIDVDVSAVDWVADQPEGAFLYINVGGDLSIKLIGDDDFHLLVVRDGYECRMAVKAIESSNTTCTGIKALY